MLLLCTLALLASLPILEPRLESDIAGLLQFLLILFLIGVDVAVSTGPERSTNNSALIITNTVGFVVNAAWVTAAYWAVHEEKTRAALGLMAVLPVTFAMPVVDIALGEQASQPTCTLAEAVLRPTPAC